MDGKRRVSWGADPSPPGAVLARRLPLSVPGARFC